MNKPYSNKTNYDPGRFRYPISFYTQGYTTDSFGNQTVTEVLSLQTRCITQRIEARLSRIYVQIAQEAGADLMDGDVYFVIRARSDWRPLKNMRVQVGNRSYTIRGIIEENEPIFYWRILCTTKEVGT